MKKLLLASFLLLPFAGQAQFKSGLNPTVIDPSSVLELEHPNKAFYLNRVSLTSTSDVATVPNPKAGMLVYNTNATIGSANPLYGANGAGIYYFDGTGWVYSGNGGVGMSNYWNLTGNSNAVDGVNFLGTTNNVALNFRVFNTKSGRIDLQGNTFFGYQAGINQTIGLTLNNTLFGSGAGSGIFNGSNNVGVGTEALQNAGNGYNNIGMGYRAGANFANTHDNTLLGNQADVTAAGINNATAIGSGAQVSQSNSVILGNNASVGIGNTAPTNKLHVTGTDPLRLEGLQGTASSGLSGSDSVLTTTATGVVKKLGVSSVLQPIKANNGLTRTGDSIQLGGTLTKATSIATNGNNLDLFGTGNLNVADTVAAGSLTSGTTLAVGTSATVGTNLTVGNTIKSTSDTVSGNTQTGTLDVVGNAVIGNNTRTKSLTATGINGGIVSDSLLNITTGGIVRKVSPIAVVANAIQADNGVSVGTGGNAGKVVLGGTLNQPTSIATAGNNLSLTGTGNLSVADSITAGNAVIAGTTTTSALTATGITNGVSTDSVLNITAAGVVRKVAPASLPNNIKANNGLTRVADSIQLGGTLSQPTTIITAGNNLSLTGTGNLNVADTASAGSLTAGNAYVTGATTSGSFTTAGTTTTNALTATGITNGVSTDSVLNITAAGVVRKVAPASLPNNIKANNGLTRVADSIQLGGTLSQPTTIITAGNNLSLTGTGNLNVGGNVNAANVSATGNTSTSTLTATGITNGVSTDSVLNITAAGVVRKVAPASLPNNIKANNGLTRVADSIQLGGTLSQPTTIITAGNNLSLTGTGNLNVADTASAGSLTAGNAYVTGATTSGSFTTAGTTTTNALTATGITNGVSTDSVLNITAAGIVRKVAPASLPNNIKANNGLTRVADSIQLGGTLSKLTTIATAGNDLNLTGSGNLSVGGNVSAANFNTGGNATVGGNTQTNTLTATGITNGVSTDSVLNITAAGVVRKVAPASLPNNIKADNGLTRVADSIELGGTLKMATTIATAGNNLSLTGAGNLNVADTVSAGRLTVGGPSYLNGVLRVTGNDTTTGNVTVGGASYVAGTTTLVGAATTNGISNTGNISTTANTSTSSLTATGITNGVSTDSVLNITAAGVVRKVAPASLPNNIKADNGLTRVADSIELGGTLKMATTINTAGNNLSLTGTGNFNVADTANVGALTVGGPSYLNGVLRVTGNDTTTGNVTVGGASYVAGTTTLVGAATTNGIANTGNISTTANTSTSSLTATGITNGVSTDSVLNITAAGVVRKVAPASLPNNIKADNGLTRVADSIELGGTLKMATTINTAGNNLNVSGTGNFNVSSGVSAGNLNVSGPATIGTNASVTGATTTGRLIVNDSAIITNSTTAGSFRTTGNTTTGSLTATGLGAGTVNDLVVTIDPATKQVRQASINTLGAVTTASNGIVKVGNDVQLGGGLTQATAINTNGFFLTLAGATGGLNVGNQTTTSTLNVGSSVVVGSTINAGGGVTAGSLNTIGATNTGSLNISSAPNSANPANLLLNITPGGNVEKVSPAAIIANIKANNGLTRNVDSIQLGGTLTQPTTITTTASNNLTIGGAGNLNVTNAVNAGSASVTGNTTTGSLTATGITNGVSTDSVLNITAAGVVRKVAPASLPNNIKADNGLTRVADSIELGGTLKMATTIDQAGNTLTFNNANITVNGPQTNNGTVRVNGNDTVTGNFTVTGAVRQNGNVTTIGNTATTGNASVTGNTATSGNTSTSTLTATGITNGVSTDSVLNITAAGIVTKVAPASLPNNIKANNGLTRVVDSIQLGGTLTKATTIVTDNANTLTIQSNGVGGASNDANQGLIVLSNTTAGGTSNRAIGTRSSLSVLNGTTVNEARALSGTTNVFGNVNGTATGAYLNTVLRPGSNLATGTTATGASGDVEVISGTTNLDNTRTLTGARFGADATNGAAARTTGVTATAVGSASSNVGVAAGANLTEAQVKSAIATQPAGFSAGVMAVNGAGGTNDRALYSSGAVQMSGLAGVVNADTVLASDLAGNVRRVPAAILSSNIKADNGLTRVADSIELGGTLKMATTINTAGNNLSLTGAGNLNVADTVSAGRLTVGGPSYLNGVLRVTGNDTTTGNVTVGGASYVAGTTTLVGAATTNGISNTGNISTTSNTSTSSLTATGITNGVSTDSVLNITAAGIVRKVAPASLPNNIKADNGLTRVADSIELGGTLKMATTINTAGNNLSLTGTGNLNVADTANVGALTVGGPSYLNGVLRVTGNDTTTGNVTVGGATYVSGNTNINTLIARGLPSGSILDSLVTVDQTGGKDVRRISINSVLGKLNAGNGITRSNDSFVLGGTLLNPTTINTNGNSLSLTGSGNLNVADTAAVGSLTSGNAYVTGTLRVTGNDTTTGNLTAGGAGYIGGSLRVAGNDTTVGNTTVGTDLYVNGNSNISTLTARNLPSGSILDSLVTVDQTGSKAVRRVSINDVIGKIKAGNGIVRVGDSLLLGGALNPGLTTINTGIVPSTSTLSFTGQGTVNVQGSLSANNFSATNAQINSALTVQAGGTSSLASATANSITITSGGTATFNGPVVANALPSGSILDSLVTIDYAAGTGTKALRRISVNDLTAKIKADNGLSRVGDSIELGGTLKMATTINTAGNNLSLTGAGNLNVADTVSAGRLTVGGPSYLNGVLRVTGNDTTTGNVTVGGASYVAGTTTLVGAATTNGISNTGNISTTANTSTSSLTATGITNGVSTDSVLNITAAGIVRKVAPASLPNNIKADNGLTRVADSIELGGTLKMATTINTAGNNLSLTGAGNLNVADTVSAGRLTVSGPSYLSGSLTATALGSGNVLDSIVTINAATGVVNKRNLNDVLATIKADNGLTRVADSIELGGSLKMNTAITTADFNLAINGSKNTVNPNGLASTFDVTNATNVASGTIGLASTSIMTDASTDPGFRLAWGSYSSGASANADAQSVAAYNEGATTATGASNGTKAVGTVGAAHAYGTASGTQARVIGVTGAADFAPPSGTSNFNGIGINGYTGDNTTGVTVGGHFDGTGSINTQFGVIGSVEGATPYEVMFDANLANHKIGIAAVNLNTTPGTNSLALYTRGQVRMTSLPVSINADTILASDVAGNVTRIAAASLPNNIKANNGLTRVADSIQLGGALTHNTTIDGSVAKVNTFFLGDDNGDYGSGANNNVVAVYNIISTPTPAASTPAAAEVVTYYGGSETSGAIDATVIGTHSTADVGFSGTRQAQGALMEAYASEGSINKVHAVGGFGVGNARGTAGANTDATVLGLSGGVDFASSTNWNGVGVDGYLKVNGNTGGVNGAGGYFNGDGPSSTSFGVVGAVGESTTYQTMLSGGLAGKHIGMAAVNRTVLDPTDATKLPTNNLALYAEGASSFNGSISVRTASVTTGTYPVATTDYMIVLSGATGITLPNPATAGNGRVLIIKNTSGSPVSAPVGYVNNTGSTATSIPANSVVHLINVFDGTNFNWQQAN